MRQMYATGQKSLKNFTQTERYNTIFIQTVSFSFVQVYTQLEFTYICLIQKNFRFIFIHMLDECETVF